MVKVFVVIFILGVLGLIATKYMDLKNNNTHKNRLIILKAVFDYRISSIRKSETPIVGFDDMETYDSTYYRIFDWGYTRILPKEKFEIIKPYISEVEKNDE